MCTDIYAILKYIYNKKYRKRMCVNSHVKARVDMFAYSADS